MYSQSVGIGIAPLALASRRLRLAASFLAQYSRLERVSAGCRFMDKRGARTRSVRLNRGGQNVLRFVQHLDVIAHNRCPGVLGQFQRLCHLLHNWQCMAREPTHLRHAQAMPLRLRSGWGRRRPPLHRLPMFWCVRCIVPCSHSAFGSPSGWPCSSSLRDSTIAAVWAYVGYSVYCLVCTRGGVPPTEREFSVAARAAMRSMCARCPPPHRSVSDSGLEWSSFKRMLTEVGFVNKLCCHRPYLGRVDQVGRWSRPICVVEGGGSSE